MENIAFAICPPLRYNAHSFRKPNLKEKEASSPCSASISTVRRSRRCSAVSLAGAEKNSNERPPKAVSHLKRIHSAQRTPLRGARSPRDYRLRRVALRAEYFRHARVAPKNDLTCFAATAANLSEALLKVPPRLGRDFFYPKLARASRMASAGSSKLSLSASRAQRTVPLVKTAVTEVVCCVAFSMIQIAASVSRADRG